VGNSKGMQKKQKPDPDLETWAKLGGGSLAPERELTEGEKIMDAGNEWAREQLTSSTLRTARSPFRRE
jgi:hypothetical protein